MRILIAVHHFPPNFTGGAEWEAYRTASQLISYGHEVRVLCVENAYSKNITPDYKDEQFNGIPVRRLSLDLSLSPDPFLWEYDNLWIGQCLKKTMEDFKPDIFHLFGGYLISGRSLVIARRQGVPSIVTLMDMWFLCRRIAMLRSDGTLSKIPIQTEACVRCYLEERLYSRLLAKIFPLWAGLYRSRKKDLIPKFEERHRFLLDAINQADLIISRSNFLKALYVDAGVDPERIKYIRQGQYFSSVRAEDLQKASSKYLRVGYFGQIAWHKGVHILLAALRRLPEEDYRATVYGNLNSFPQYSGKLKRLVRKNIALAGIIGQDSMWQAMRELDVVVVPSINYENSPNVILQAFVYRTPVVVSNLGGMAELVEHEKNGLLFNPGDASDLALQLRRLKEDTDLLYRLREGIGTVKSMAEEMDELLEIYRRFVAGK